MRKKSMIVSLFIFTLILTACGNKAYEAAIENGMNALEEKEYNEAVPFFEAALEEKPDDKTASQYLSQTANMINGLIALDEGTLHEAKTFFRDVEKVEEGTATLKADAKEALHMMEELEENYTNLENVLKDAEKLKEKKEYKDALAKIDEALEEDFSHASIQPFEDDFKKLHTDVQDAKEKADLEAKKKKEEEKRLAKENKKEQEQEQINKVLGYWLSADETMACHITESYIACAVKQSDVIFNDPVASMEGNIDENSVIITFDDGSNVTYSTKTPDILDFDTETFSRVSKETANAIYDGYYKLP